MPCISPEPQKRSSQQSFPYLYSKYMKAQSDSVLYISIYGVVFHALSYSMILVYWNLLQKELRFVIQTLKALGILPNRTTSKNHGIFPNAAKS